MAVVRSRVDYALARRSTLAALFTGRASSLDVCDAHPYLLRAAKFHGERTELDCPVCKKERLIHVTYTYGDVFKAEVNGRVRQSVELQALADEYGEFTVYVVEVCRSCGWNHLDCSYVLESTVHPPVRLGGAKRVRRGKGAAAAAVAEE
ncbi:MAG: hypothetical protein QOJ92_1247 [Frankiales bacterium]|nr:hypothetical protein [Frankiales bacterium]